MQSAPVILFFIMLPLLSWGGIELQLSKYQISQDETVDLLLIMQGSRRVDRAPDLPLPDGLNLIAPSIQHSTSIVNGRTRSSVRASYRIRAARSGAFTIGPYDVEWEGKTVTLGPLKLEVTPSVQQVFSEVATSSTNVLTQQSFDLSITIYSAKQISNVELASFDKAGLDVGNFREMNVRDKVVDGRRMHTRMFTARAKALSAGWVEFAPELTISLLDGRQRRRMGPFGMINSGPQLVQITKPDPVRIRVQSPPEKGRPASFAGAVGEFRLDVTASPLKLKAGDPITLKMQVYGKGNMKNVLPPTVEQSKDFKVYEAKLIEERLNEDGSGGYKTLEQVVIPLHENVEEIPELRFSFFDPARMKYRELRQGPFALTVSPADQTMTPLIGATADNPEAGPAASIVGEDLVYLKSAGAPSSAPLSTQTFLTLTTAPALLWLLTGVTTSALKRRTHDPAKRRLAGAPKRLRQHLARMKELQDEPEAFHDEMWNALSDYFADRFNLPPGEVNIDRLRTLLVDKVSDELLEETSQWFQRMDQSRYGVDTAGPQPGDDLVNFEGFVQKWEKVKLR